MSESDPAIEEDDLHAFVDGQLAPERRRRLERYLQTHPAEARRVADYQAQRDELRDLFAANTDTELPPKLQLAHLVRTRVRPLWAPWRLAASLVLAVGLGIAGGWFLWGPRPQSLSERAMQVLVEQAFSTYSVYVPDARHPIEVAAAEQAHLTQWLSNRLHRTVTAPDLSNFGYALLGGRLLATESGSPAALLMYSNPEGHRVALLLRPMLPTLRVADEERATGATQLCAWIAKGMGYALVASIPRAELDDLADQIRDASGTSG